MEGNREYKSDVFSMLMEDKENALALYNALNGSFYTDPDDVEMCTLEKGISLTVRNDASFVLDSSLSLYEHQSTVCPNMPLRNLIYVANHLERYVKKQRLNLFGHSLAKIPTPKFAVFYNGNENQPEQYEYKLSDCFEKKTDEPQLELKCMVYNINKGNNKDIMRDFLIARREEVAKVTNLDFTFERQIELEREEAENKGLLRGREEGLSRGLEEGIRIEIFKSVSEGDYGIHRGAEKLGISEDEFVERMKAAGYEVPINS